MRTWASVSSTKRVPEACVENGSNGGAEIWPFCFSLGSNFTNWSLPVCFQAVLMRLRIMHT